MKYFIPFFIVGIFAFMRFRMVSTSRCNQKIECILARNPVIIDVRTPEEFRLGHIKSAINISLAELENGIPLSLNHDKSILTYCSHGVRSVRAVELLVDRGYKNAVDGGSWTKLQMLFDKAHRLSKK